MQYNTTNRTPLLQHFSQPIFPTEVQTTLPTFRRDRIEVSNEIFRAAKISSRCSGCCSIASGVTFGLGGFLVPLTFGINNTTVFISVLLGSGGVFSFSLGSICLIASCFIPK